MKPIEKIRIISASVRDRTTEVEIIIEKTTNPGHLDEKFTLHQVWIDCASEHIAAKLIRRGKK